MMAMMVMMMMMMMATQYLSAVFEEPVDVDHDGEDEDGYGDHCGRVSRELVVRPKIFNFF